MDAGKRLPRMIALALGAIVVVAVGSPEIAKGEYYGSVGTTADWTDYHYVDTDSKTELAMAYAHAETYGYALCTADAYSDE
jgi:hypothetical protein